MAEVSTPWYDTWHARLPERGTGGCRTSPYDANRHQSNIAKQFRNKRNRQVRADQNKGGKAR